MVIKELYNELTRIKQVKMLTQREREKLSIEWVNKYAKENKISFNTALDNLSNFVEAKKKGEQ